MYTVLKVLRRKNDLTQKQVAEALHITVSTYAKIEQGKNQLAEAYYDDLAELFHLPVGSLFAMYHDKNFTGENNDSFISPEGGIDMSAIIHEELDFGPIVQLSYFYVNMAQGPDFYKFGLPKEKAEPFVKKIDFACKTLDKAFKVLNPMADSLPNCCYEVKGDMVEFFSYILGPVIFNNEFCMDEGEAINRLDEIDETDQVSIRCKLICDEDDFGNYLGLQLSHVGLRDKDGNLKPDPRVKKRRRK